MKRHTYHRYFVAPASRRHFIVLVLVIVIVIVIVIDFSSSSSSCTAAPPVTSATAILRTDWHDDYHALDLHALTATAGVWGNTRLTRALDGVVNIALPGADLHPFEGSIDSIRIHYYRWGLSDFRPTRRVGDLCSALQIRELSLSDLSLQPKYQIQRVQGVIDWSQLVVADIGDLVTRPFGVDSMVVLQYPYWPVDHLQTGLDLSIHKVSIFLGNIGDHLLSGIEHLADHRRSVPLPPAGASQLVFAPSAPQLAER